MPAAHTFVADEHTLASAVISGESALIIFFANMRTFLSDEDTFTTDEHTLASAVVSGESALVILSANMRTFLSDEDTFTAA